MAEEKGWSLLIVDDEAEIRKGLATTLDRPENNLQLIMSVRNGMEALTFIRRFNPDIVITDIRMPFMDGLTLIKSAREEGYQGNFIVISGFDDFNYAKTALHYGVREYLLKPISIPELCVAIQRINAENSVKMLEKTHRQALEEIAGKLKTQHLAMDLAHNTVTKDELNEHLRRYPFPLSDAPCQVILLKLTEKQSDEDWQPEDTRSQGVAAIQQQLENIFSATPMVCVEHGDNQLLLLINTPAALEPGYLNMEDFLSQQLKTFYGESGLNVVAAIGEEAPSLFSLSLSYQSALQALPWHIYAQMRPVISHVATLTAPPPALKPFDSKAIIEGIWQGDLHAISHALHSFFQWVMYIETPPPSYLFAMCNYLIVDVQKQLAQYSDAPLLTFTSDAYMTLGHLDSIQRIQDWLASLFFSFARELKSSRLQKSDPILEKTLSYINEHILDNIRVEDICSYIALSKTYFTTYFKNKTSQNFRDYVLDRKILYAQNAMKAGTYSLTELAEKLGYEDYRSFNRAFKTRTGFAPSEYQRKYNKDGRE